MGKWVSRAPSGDASAYLHGDLVMVGGRHLCSIKDGELRRSFDASRELLDGSLLFRCDVLKLAATAGVAWVVAKDRRTGKMWRVALDAYRHKGWRYTHPQFGAQIGLKLDEFEEVEPTEPRQLSLFGGQP